MPVQLERRMRLPPDPRSALRARRMLQEALRGLTDGSDADADAADTVVLLGSELCDNAVLHAGTEFEVAVSVADEEVVVEVTDRGAGPLELHLSLPRRQYGRAATHGRGLALVQKLSTRWGTRHESDGRHVIWFAVARPGAAAPAPDPAADAGGPGPERVWEAAEQARWLLHVPSALADRLEPDELVAELARRLRELLGAASVSVEVDEGDGTGAREVTRAGDAPDPDAAARTEEVRLAVTAPLRGVVRVVAGPGGPEGPDVPAGSDGSDGALSRSRARDLTELMATRVAMAVESQWLRGVDQRRRSWMTYLAEASELLGQSLDVELAVAVVPQVVVPRLGRWCAVLLLDEVGRPRLAALTHADEEELPELRAALDPLARPGPAPELRARLDEVLREGAPAVRFAVPTDGIAVPMRTRGRTIGALVVGRRDGRQHTPEDVVLAGDIARRAALAIHNAQTTAAQVSVSQALQQALLPRALPLAPGLEFAAAYVSATGGSDVSGDFYDVLAVDTHHWLLSIGDVCGKGARAAARTGLVRDVLRVLVRDGRTLVRAIELLNDVMMDADDPLQYSTLAAATVSRPGPGEPPGLGVDLVLAGHLQPLVVRAGGGAEPVGRFGTAVGLLPEVQVECSQHRLRPGDTLLLYTDGVTERRRGREQFGRERLVALAGRLGGRTAAEVVGAVRDAVEGFSPEPMGDDVALLAVRAAP